MRFKVNPSSRTHAGAAWCMSFIFITVILVTNRSFGSQYHSGLATQAPKGGLPVVSHRDDLADVLERLGLKTGAELGVQTGTFSKHNLERWKSCEKYYLVDIWRQQANYNDSANVDNANQEAFFQGTRNLLQPWSNVTVFLRMLTSEAAKLIPDNSLDFVYVDARHDYCGTMEDLQLYWPKLRRGGVFAGHDYVDAAAAVPAGQDWSLCLNGTRHPGAVKGAVDEFAFQHDLILSSTTRDWPSWMTRKV